MDDKKEDSSVHIPFHTEEEHMDILESGSSDPSSPGSNNTDFSSHGSTKNSTPASSHSPTSASSSKTPPTKFRSLKDVYSACSFALLAVDPLYYEEAAEQPEWKNAMIEEIQSIEKNQTWELVDLPEGKNVIVLKWIFKTKYNADGSVKRHKAQLVAKGYSQQQGIDFEETFSPVARFETVRTILALAAQLGWPVYQFDVKSAFLNGDLQEEVYVSRPEGFISSEGKSKVYRLKKALYGLKQAPRA